MSEAEKNTCRFTSMEEPDDERMAQSIYVVAEDARENSRWVAKCVAANIKSATQ